MRIFETVATVKAHYKNHLATAEDDHEWAYAWRGEINNGGFHANEFLMQEIVETGKCIGCASCVAICPTSVFDDENEQPEDNQIGVHKLATSRSDLLTCAASRYTYSPNTLALQEAMEQGAVPLAVVGVPCQINAVRLQQNSSIKSEMTSWYRDNIKLTIGLACSEAFTHESLQKLGEMLDGYVLDDQDRGLVDAVEIPRRLHCCYTLMESLDDRVNLASECLQFASRLARPE